MMTLDIDHSMSAHAMVEGGTLLFMAPELLVPAKFGLGSSIPTREADTFAFGLVVLQVLLPIVLTDLIGLLTYVGSHRETAISLRHSPRMHRCDRRGCTTRETRGSRGYWTLASCVGSRAGVLGGGQGSTATHPRDCGRYSRCGCQMAYSHTAIRPVRWRGPAPRSTGDQ